ncbi:MAG: family 10 glycosylhydrolase, partial [Armatimonadetes bacterium]|nr:family 10 glycosylhydrolase [Armatimonadota bacterium]
MILTPSLLLSLLLLLVCAALPAAVAEETAKLQPPAPQREFRGVWVASVANIDWPSKRGLTPAQQKEELIRLMDRARDLRLNALVFQVRPAADALYASLLEPWSEYLTGQMGKAPEPFYDPLAFAVEEAHRRGLELHAWFNPYRARHASATSPISADHISRTRPHLVKSYGKSLWLDPGEPAVQEHSLRVILDVVRRYDIDGAHIDDYFYPYKERDANGQIIEFPDEPSWQAYRQSGGELSRESWRRENVNGFVRRLYEGIKAEKPWVKFGVSPFGIWRPGFPEQIRGFDAYEQLYADSRLWLEKGWLDYFTPQLYWKIETTGQSYPVLLNWWAEQNPQGRHLWPGNYTGRVGGAAPNDWPPEEIVYQVKATRGHAGATWNVQFSAKPLLREPN